MTRRLCWAAVLAAFAVAATPVSADTVKIGVVQGLSGPPAITDFGESYLQGIKSAVKDYEAAGG
jgi:branched-chain amino acid transport system substrate-binding protein